MFKWINLFCVCIYPTLPPWAGCVLIWIQSFISPWLVAIPRLKSLVCTTIYPSPRIWTRVAMSISYNGLLYTICLYCCLYRLRILFYTTLNFHRTSIDNIKSLVNLFSVIYDLTYDNILLEILLIIVWCKYWQ